MKDKRIQIPLRLYDLMIAYIYDHYDETDRERFGQICRGIEQKTNASLRHSAYSIAKNHSDPQKKEAARQYYLDLVGMKDSFRWLPVEPDSTSSFVSGTYTDKNGDMQHG